MNWNQSTDEISRQKVQKLMSNFESYLYEVHSPQDEHDLEIIHKWKWFKELIQKDPNDLTKLHSYLLKISGESRKQAKLPEINRKSTQPAISQIEARNKQLQELPFVKNGLKSATKSFLSTLLANNRILQC